MGGKKYNCIPRSKGIIDNKVQLEPKIRGIFMEDSASNDTLLKIMYKKGGCFYDISMVLLLNSDGNNVSGSF